MDKKLKKIAGGGGGPVQFYKMYRAASEDTHCFAQGILYVYIYI